MADVAVDAVFEAFLAEGRFMIQRARASGRHLFYPRVIEPGTGVDDLEWVAASGRGTVYSATVMRRKPPEADYSLILVDLAEGPRMMSRATGIDPAEVRIGMAVVARIEPLDGKPAVLFAPDPTA